MVTLRRFAGLTLIVLILSCSPQKNDKNLKPIAMAQIKEVLHESYFAKFKLDADLEIKRKDSAGEHISKGHLHIDRGDTSRLTIDQKKPYTMTLTENNVSIKIGKAKPMVLDLNNINHYVVPFREICIIEPNPFRYLDRFHKFLIDDSDNDTVTVFIKEASEHPHFGDIRVFIHRRTKYLMGIDFYSLAGDLGRSVVYKHPIEKDGIFIPTDIVINFAGEGEVVKEEYLLKNINVVPEHQGKTKPYSPN